MGWSEWIAVALLIATLVALPLFVFLKGYRAQFLEIGSFVRMGINVLIILSVILLGDWLTGDKDPMRLSTAGLAFVLMMTAGAVIYLIGFLVGARRRRNQQGLIYPR